MTRNILSLSFKIAVSAAFLLLLFRRLRGEVDIASLLEVLRQSRLLLVGFGFFFLIALTVLAALRWFLLLGNQGRRHGLTFSLIWKLTMVGYFFNIFLPTGAGGDLAKIFYLVREKEEKLLLGSSVVVDRFLGALSVTSMAFCAVLLVSTIEERIRLAVILVFLLLWVLFLAFAFEKASTAFGRTIGKILPRGTRDSLRNLHRSFNAYLRPGREFLLPLAISFILQILSFLGQYLMVLGLLQGTSAQPGPAVFFIYIPIIWMATLIPSIGGLGIREATYVHFFAEALGTNQAVVLSLLVLVSILLQACVGAVVFLLLSPSATQPGRNRPPGRPIS